jgi:hypothetical protein
MNSLNLQYGTLRHGDHALLGTYLGCGTARDGFRAAEEGIPNVITGRAPVMRRWASGTAERQQETPLSNAVWARHGATCLALIIDGAINIADQFKLQSAMALCIVAITRNARHTWP